MSQKKVVVIGGGFGGLTATKALAQTNCNVLLIDKTNHHLFQPLLYEVATAAISPGEIATPLREILRHQENTSVIMGEVAKIAYQTHQVMLTNGDLIDYDYLLIAIGARHCYFGQENWEQFAPGLKTINDALKIREQILLSFEKAERLGGGPKTEEYLNFVIIGGGPTGVEMAGAIGEIAHRTLFKNFRKIRPETSKVYLLEALPNILPMYPTELALRAKKDLEKLGVHVITGKKVTNITGDGVHLEEMFIRSKNVIWAAGNQVSPLLQSLNVPLDRAGRAIVEKDLSIPGHSNIFVIGDAANCKGKDGNPLPGTAPVAIQEGKYVAKTIARRMTKTNCPPFLYFDKGSMATIGRAKAIAMVGRFRCGGFLAWLMWAFIHIAYLIGFRNRLKVMLEWMAAIVTGERGVRLITKSIDVEKRPE